MNVSVEGTGQGRGVSRSGVGGRFRDGSPARLPSVSTILFRFCPARSLSGESDGTLFEDDEVIVNDIENLFQTMLFNKTMFDC